MSDDRGIALLDDVSFEMMSADIDEFVSIADELPAGTRAHLSHLAGEPLERRRDAARRIEESGHRPFPQIAVRRLASRAELDAELAAFSGWPLLVIAGDPAIPAGPFADTAGALAATASDGAAWRAASEVGVAGYAEGHPDIPGSVLAEALDAKLRILADAGIPAFVATQFVFTPAAVLDWLAETRERGVTVPIRIGVAGPAPAATIADFAAKFGANLNPGPADSAGATGDGDADPTWLLDELRAGIDPAVHGEVRIHLFTFGGVARTLRWFADYRRGVAEE